MTFKEALERAAESLVERAKMQRDGEAAQSDLDAAETLRKVVIEFGGIVAYVDTWNVDARFGRTQRRTI